MQDGRCTWTNEQLELLRQHYPCDSWDTLLKLLHNHSKDAIRIKAKTLKIRRNISALQRFMSFVEKPDDGCWYWTGNKCRGYGQFKYRGKSKRAHRWIYEHYNGKIPNGLTIDHKCKNTSCVNPEHLRLVTAIENVMMGNAAPAQNARKTHCKNGHKLEHPNLVGNKPNRRRCRICHNDYMKNYRVRKTNEC